MTRPSPSFTAIFLIAIIALTLPAPRTHADDVRDALRRDAYAGDAFSQRLYAIMLSHDHADDGEIDEYEGEEIIRWLECAALQGDDAAIEQLQNVPYNFDISETGRCEYTGAGYTADDPKPDPYALAETPDADQMVQDHQDLWQAASNGDPDAQFKLGEFYKPSPSDPGNIPLAEIWYNCAARQGHQKAIDYLEADNMFARWPKSQPCPLSDQIRDANGNLVEPVASTPPVTATTPFISATETPSPLSRPMASAEEIYGAAHDTFYGTGRDQSYDDALTLARKAADLDHAGAINLLGVIYRSGLGVAQDLSEAVYHFRRAAELGEVVAMNNLGDCYLSGIGLEANLLRAVEWYEKAAIGGNASAQYNLSSLYQSGGEGMNPDPVLARYWMRLSAQNGDPDAPYYYGSLLEYGVGGPEDPAAAIPWYQKAVELGDINGYAAMGRLHYYGEYAPKNLERAWLYLAIAEDGGHPDARDWRETIEPDLSFEERSRAIVAFTKYRAQKAEADSPPPRN